MALLDYWPSPERIEAVMPLDAEALDDAVLMAVHRPVRFKSDGLIVSWHSEDDLLRALSGSAHGNPIVVTMQGKPGAGKTHVLRWIEIQLRDRIDFHIVRVPGNAGIDAIRQAMAPPSGPANADEAVDVLLDWFKHALLREKEQAQQRIADARQRGTPAAREDSHLAQWLAEGLHHLLADAEMVHQFVARGQSSPRLLDRLALHVFDPTSPTVEFRDDDFLKRDDVDVLQAGEKARTCVRQLMLTAAVGKPYRELAASLLNRLSAEAIGELGRKASTPPKVLLDRLQSQLRAEGKQLVVLIDGSDAELPSEWPRPMAGWSMDDLSDAGPSTVISSVVDRVGEYLHASRKQCDRTEDQNTLEAFGRSSAGHALFPFNCAAIEAMASHDLQMDGVLTLNPRAVIEHVLRDTLLPHRDDFEQGRFPPPDFHGFAPDRLAPAVREALQQQYSGDLLARHAVVLGFWGGNPDRLEDSPLSPQLYAAFGLEPPTVPVVPPFPIAEVPFPAPVPEVPAPAIPEPVPVTEAPAVIPETAAPEDPEVRAFLDAVAGGGAPLALLTPAVVQWLLEHSQYEAFRIVRND